MSASDAQAQQVAILKARIAELEKLVPSNKGGDLAPVATTVLPFSPIWDAVAAHFFSPAALNRVVAMSQAGVQVEGWWKTELILLLSHLEKQGTVKWWNRECRTNNGQQDFQIAVAGATAAIELKTALCGRQKANTYNLIWYARDPKRYFPSDIRKLTAVEASHRYLLVFAYAASSSSEWQETLRELNRHANGASVNLARLDNSPGGELSIGWLEVKRAV